MSIRKSLSTSLRITSDIWCLANGILQLFPSSALRIIDHHLHASGIIPTTTHTDPRRIYDHDWYCVSQAVTCFPVENLIRKGLEDESSPTNSHIWVHRVGKSSILLGNVITLDDQVLATAQRVFVRRQRGESAVFSDTERHRLLHDCFIDDSMLEYLDDDAEHPLPLLENFGTFLHKGAADNQSASLTVKVGPQHVNFGNHCDHAFLTETAVHAMILAKIPVESVAIQYVSEAMLGNELKCLVFGDRISIVRKHGDGKRVLVLVAKGAKRQAMK